MGLFTSNNSAKKRQEEIDAQRIRQGKLSTKNTEFAAQCLISHLLTDDLDALLTTFAPDFVNMLSKMYDHNLDGKEQTIENGKVLQDISEKLDTLNSRLEHLEKMQGKENSHQTTELQR